MAVSRTPRQRRLSPASAAVLVAGVGAGVEQRPRGGGVAQRDGVEERRAAVGVLRVDGGAAPQQNRDDGVEPARACAVQRCGQRETP